MLYHSVARNRSRSILEYDYLFSVPQFNLFRRDDGILRFPVSLCLLNTLFLYGSIRNYASTAIQQTVFRSHKVKLAWKIDDWQEANQQVNDRVN